MEEVGCVDDVVVVCVVTHCPIAFSIYSNKSVMVTVSVCQCLPDILYCIVSAVRDYDD